MTGGGVQRWLKLTKYFSRDVQPIVYTPARTSFMSGRDESLLREVASHVEVWRHPIWEPQRMFTSRKGMGYQGVSEAPYLWRFLRGNLFVPDAKILWLRPSLRFLMHQLRAQPVDAVLSTGPPHSLHWLAMRLKQQTGLPWIADFRDPWTDWDFFQTLPLLPFVRRRHVEMEAQVLRDADAVLTVSKAWSKRFQARGARKVLTLPNGFDPQDVPARWPAVPKELRLVHMGMLNLTRARTFFEALETLHGTHPVLARRVQVCLGGHLSSDLQRYLRQHPVLSRQVRCVGYLSHKEVMAQYAAAQVLLVFAGENEKDVGHLPGKLFECLAVPRRVLLFGHSEGEAAQCLGPHDRVVSFCDAEGAVRTLRHLLETPHPQPFPLRKVCETQTRPRQAETFCAWLRELLDGQTRFP